MTDLFNPVQIGAWTLNNRIVMAPLTRCRVYDNGIPGKMQAEYYAQRASAGLIISEATNISPQARGYAYTPGIYNEAQIAGWQQVTQAVHDQGGTIICQLWHVGRYSHPDLQPDGALPVAPSALAPEGDTLTETGMQKVPVPRALETNEIAGLIEDYRHAAACAKRAGFDGVEVHSANCYLLEQFIRDSTNQRTDVYGGSIENRTRLTLAVTRAVIEIWGAQRVGIRLSPVTPHTGNTPLDSTVMDTYGYLIKQLDTLGLAYLHFVEGATGQARNIPDNIDLNALRQLFSGPYMANNLYDRDMALTARRNDTADLICFGRPFIANPDLVYRLEHHAPIVTAPRTCFYGGNEQGYTDWPALVNF